jgi:hypothetical protein
LHVLVAAAGQVHEDGRLVGRIPRQLHRIGDGVRRLEGGNNPFEARQRLEPLERLRVGDVGVLGPADIA